MPESCVVQVRKLETLEPVEKTADSTRSHDISGLDVAMYNASVVQIQHGGQQRLQYGLHLPKVFAGTTSDILATSGDKSQESKHLKLLKVTSEWSPTTHT